jgi:hypothetical protein
MSEILEGTKFSNYDGMPEMNVRGRRIEAELNAQWRISFGRAFKLCLQVLFANQVNGAFF